MSQRGAKRVVVWSAGFVGKMVIAEVVTHPFVELVAVGMSSSDEVVRGVGDICGKPEPVGAMATGDVEALLAPKPAALMHHGPTATPAKDSISLIKRFAHAGSDVCSTAMTPWIWPRAHLNPPIWTESITQACELDESRFTTGIARAARITLGESTTTWATWVTSAERNIAKGVIKPGHVAAVRFRIHGIFKEENWIQLGFTHGFGRDLAPAECLPPGMRALNAVPAVSDPRPGRVTPADLPPIAGAGNSR